MVNKYRKGADYERLIVNKARQKGLIAFRSAGSHSPIDVCIIDINNKLISFIQCKNTKIPLSQGRIEKLKEENKEIKGEFSVRFQVI